MPLPFEQLPNESNKAFAAFSTYLNLGPNRSFYKSAQKLGKSARLLRRWADKFDWAGRLAAHASHLAALEREALETTARGKAAEWSGREQKLREAEWVMHERAIAAAQKGLDAFMEREKVYANLSDIARMLEIASKLGRLATGLGTDGEGRKGDDLPTLRVEVSVALDKIYGQPEAGHTLPPANAPAPIGEAGPAKEIVDVVEVKDGGKAESGKRKAGINETGLGAVTGGQQ